MIASMRMSLMDWSQTTYRGADIKDDGSAELGTITWHGTLTGRDPKTGECVDVPAPTAPTFKAGKMLKSAVNESSVS